jgi:protein gp88
MAKKKPPLKKDVPVAGAPASSDSGSLADPSAPTMDQLDNRTIPPVIFSRSPFKRKKKKKPYEMNEQINGGLAKGKDVLADQLTSTKGVSDRGIEARRGDTRKPGVTAHGFARVSDPSFHAKRAKEYFRSVLNAQRAVPPPNLPKAEIGMTPQQPAPNYGKVTVKQPPKSPGFGTVTVKEPPKSSGFGRVIMKSAKFGVSPKAIADANAKLAPVKPAPVPEAPHVTHVAGVEVPHELHEHMRSGDVVPYDHPAREKAAEFVTKVWRQNKFEGQRMSSKLLGIGDSGQQESASAKPGYATIKSEPLIKEADKKVPSSPAPEKYNPKLERPNQRARVADVKAQMMADPSKTRVSLSTSNSKLAKDGVASFNLVPIETCPGAGSCAKYCYADTGSYLRFHKTTMPPRVANWLASQKEDFVPKMVDLIAGHKKKGKIKAIRVHDSGDFYSPEYIDKWHQIASAHPDMPFYAYTKSHHPKLRERLNELEKLPNFNIVQSFGSKYDHLIDPSKPHAVVFPDEESMHRAGYADAMATDLTASDKNNKKVGLYIHGQYDKSYPGLQEHIKGNPQIAKDINEALGVNGGEIKKSEKQGLRKLLKRNT